MYCSISEAAGIIGVTRPTIYRMIADGELKRETMLGRPAIRLREVERLSNKVREQREDRIAKQLDKALQDFSPRPF